MENKLFAYFDFNPTKAYPVVYGATYTETFNEEINSFNIVLDNVSEEDRLYFDRPYHFVKIVNEIPDGETGLLFKGKNYIIMLVDTFVENLNSMGDEKIYRYEIGLMNCIKLLEKIQCPNLMITHSLVEGENKPIYVYIDRYMRLYSPKVKISTDGETWNYEYLLNWDNICGVLNPNYNSQTDPESEQWLIEPDPIFNVPAADMQMNEPTLRQLITNLMSQVACIPSFDFRTLTYINFREEPSNANVTDTNGINFIKHSGASDSYASDLVASLTQALQEENTVIADIVGFRDSANAIISQTKNLQLEVRYPIYKIKEVRMRTTDSKRAWFNPANENRGVIPVLLGKTVTSNLYRPKLTLISQENGMDVWEIEINYIYCMPVNNYIHPGKLFDIKVHFCNYLGQRKYEEIKVISLFKGYLGSVSWNGFEMEPGVPDENGEIMLTEDKGFAVTCASVFDTRPIIVEDSSKIIQILGGLFETYKSVTYNIKFRFNVPTISNSQFNNYASHVWFENIFTDNVTGAEIYQFVPMSHVLNNNDIDVKLQILEDNDNAPFDTFYDVTNTPMDKLFIPANIGSYLDITPCIVEQGKRKLLNVDFDLLDDLIDNSASMSIEELAQYIYGTMGYTIGDTKITGFSETYSRAQWWWSVTSSYFDTILRFFNKQNRQKRYEKFDFIEFNQVLGEDYEQYMQDCGYNLPKKYQSNFLFIEGVEKLNPSTTEKMKLLFYIYYQPLNNFKYKATKEGKNFPLAIEQLNQLADGLSDFERVVKNLQDTTNRIGNPIKSLPQTTDDIDSIKPLNSIYNDGHYDFTIFHRQFAIYEKYLTVNYTASENYVIKNYFTSIITKYRAYQYVDYNAAIVRKENTKIHCLISDKHYYDGDNKIKFYQEFYTLNDLKNILDVDDINDYVSYGDEEEKALKELGSVGFNFFYRIVKLNGNPHTSNPEWYISANQFVVNSEGKKDFYGMSLNAPHINYNSPGKAIVWDTSNLLLLEKYLNKASNIEYIARDMLAGLKQDFPTIQTDYFTSAKIDILSKMNGSILKDNRDNHNYYYKIEINKRAKNPVGGYIYGGSEILEENFPIQEKTYIYEFFRIANRLAWYQGYINTPNYLKFYQNHNVARLQIHYKYFSIRLIEITDENKIMELEEKNNVFKIALLSGLIDYEYAYRPRYCIKQSYNQNNSIEETKNECSLVVANNSFAIYYQDYDNVSAGPILHTLRPGTDLDKPEGVGGYIQKWQVWNLEKYGNAHQVSFAYEIFLNSSLTLDHFIGNLPIITEGWEYIPFTIFRLVDNNKNENFDFTFYKDNAEILNQTLQFEYYSDDGSVIFNNNFIKNNQMINFIEKSNNSVFVMFDITNEPFKTNNTIYDSDNSKAISQKIIPVPRPHIENNPPFAIRYEPMLEKPYVEIDWESILEENSTIEQIKIALVSELQMLGGKILDLGCRDLIAFKRNNRTEKTRYYLTLNDTKTNDVWYFPDPDDLFITVPVLNGLARNISNAAPEVLFDINWTDFNNEEDNSYSITIANNNMMPVVLHISGTNLTFNMSAESRIVLQSTTDLNNELDDYVRYRESDLTCNFTGNIGENLTVILPEITVLAAPIISNNYIESYGDFIGLTTSIINDNDCLVILYMQGSSNATIITYEINPHTTLILSTDTNNPNYDSGFANSISASLGAFFSGGLEDDYYCYFMDYGENIESNNTIILNTIPEPPHIQTITEEPNDFRYDITSDNPYTTRVYLKKGSQHVDAGSLFPNLHLSIGYGGDATITDWYNAWIDGQLEDDVVVYLVSYGYESDEVILWRANG